MPSLGTASTALSRKCSGSVHLAAFSTKIFMLRSAIPCGEYATGAHGLYVRPSLARARRDAIPSGSPSCDGGRPSAPFARARVLRFQGGLRRRPIVRRDRLLDLAYLALHPRAASLLISVRRTALRAAFFADDVLAIFVSILVRVPGSSVLSPRQIRGREEKCDCRPGPRTERRMALHL